MLSSKHQQNKLGDQPIIADNIINKELIKEDPNDYEFDDNYLINFQNFTRKELQKRQTKIVEEISD